MRRKKLTIKYLQSIGACKEAIEWMESHKERDIQTLFKQALKTKEHLDWGNWVICRLMTHPQRIKYSAYAAKQVLKNFEDEYPQDTRPRDAINAALKCLKNPSETNRNAAASAERSAESAKRSAANAASAASVVWSAESAASAASAVWSAASAERSAASAMWSATSAVWSAANAASAASAERSAASAERSARESDMQIKILKYGLKLLQEKTMKTITEYMIKDHGVTHGSFFHTPDKGDYDEVHVGMSYDSYKNALVDAIDSLLFENYEIPDKIEKALEIAEEENMVEHCITTNAFASDTEPGLLGYYVSIRVTAAPDSTEED